VLTEGFSSISAEPNGTPAVPAEPPNRDALAEGDVLDAVPDGVEAAGDLVAGDQREGHPGM